MYKYINVHLSNAEELPVTSTTPKSPAAFTRHREGEIRAARGTQLTAKSWMTEAPLRMLMNNLDPQVAENPTELVVYGGIGRAARNWECYDKIVESLTNLTMTKPCWCSRASRSACSKPTAMRRGC